MADHNDPNAVNSIFSDIDVSAADLYDIFGFPSEHNSAGEAVVIALTFAAVPQTGVLDSDMLYRVLIAPDRRLARSETEDTSLEGFLAYLEAVKDKYLNVLKPSEIRVTVDPDNRAHIGFLNFAGGSFSATVATNRNVTLQSPGGQQIKIYVGGRDDAFFNDLPGFFRSINYAPQFYHVPHTMPELRELKIPKTFSSLRETTSSISTRATRNGAMVSSGSSRQHRRRGAVIASKRMQTAIFVSCTRARMRERVRIAMRSFSNCRWRS